MNDNGGERLPAITLDHIVRLVILGWYHLYCVLACNDGGNYNFAQITVYFSTITRAGAVLQTLVSLSPCPVATEHDTECKSGDQVQHYCIRDTYTDDGGRLHVMHTQPVHKTNASYHLHTE